MTPEEAVHKLIKINLPQGQENELPSMVVECCSQAPTYQKFFGLIGERFAKLNRLWNELFEVQFKSTYDIIHRYETNRLRNVARFFGHMFASDALGWHAMSCIVMTEDATTSSARIFVKILFQEISEIVGLAKVAERMKDPMLQPSLEGMFPRDEPKNVRFSINYFTSIGMGVLTEEMREFLQNMPKPTLPAPPADDSDSDSVSSNSSSYTGSSYSRRSRSRSIPAKRDRRDRSRSRGRSSTRSRSYSRSASPRRDDRSRSYSSVSPPRKRTRQYSGSRSRSRSLTPGRESSPGRRGYGSSPSKSPPRRRYMSDSRSRSPRRRQDDRSATRSRSRSARRSPTRSASYDSRRRSPAPKRRRMTRSVSPRSRSRSRSYSRSISRSVSRLPTPTPDKRRRREGVVQRDQDNNRSRSPVGKRRRHSSSRGRSPVPPPAKRGRTGD
jgi:pre-mRNA-splicing factor CWC22